MSKTVIEVGLSDSDIGRAIKELKAYKVELNRKTTLFRKRVAERIAALSESGFAGAVVDDLVNGTPRMAEVKVYSEHGDDISLVVADGDDAVWVEFGTGVHHNGAVGSSPHPKGAELGFTIGGYGKGMGQRQVWGFVEDGELHLTHGAPSVMPLYNAVMTVCADIDNIAREVFG
jgi:hypothetical protein